MASKTSGIECVLIFGPNLNDVTNQCTTAMPRRRLRWRRHPGAYAGPCTGINALVTGSVSLASVLAEILHDQARVIVLFWRRMVVERWGYINDTTACVQLPWGLAGTHVFGTGQTVAQCGWS